MRIPLGEEILIKKKKGGKKKKRNYNDEEEAAAFSGNSCFFTFVKTSHIVSYVFYKGLLQLYYGSSFIYTLSDLYW